MDSSIKYACIGSGAAIICIIALMTASSVIRKMNEHTCRWRQCPYKEITPSHAHDAVSNYTGEIGTDAYRIDILHIQYPTLDADQLDSLLTSK